ncbi:DUF1028 domain-containing protein [Natronosalvus rutilus]|uniref:DUF1028 domain-containing protein n=1 Tax=Natronosalvus rutilus TaxID=2953753 RepID=A0A9E7SSL4_9EURY|nr:DUF1028 domain-containing protein [Natronosalvus rutilus]UTF52674.1 DUF1028 domain-containing protein [Natronosalvus rutilus]
MTFSICATVDGSHGVAIATKAIAVGSTAPFVCRKGAVCTQATTSTPLGVRAVRALEAGATVEDAVESQLADDPDAAVRQVHGVDAGGDTVAVTGSECVPVAGDLEGEGYTVAGNMLESADVLAVMADTFESSSGEPLDRRLLDALRAGEDAGGDKRGEHAQSAALRVFDPDDPRLAHDLRVDEHDDAVAELERIHDLATTVGNEWEEAYPRANVQRYPKRNSQ